MIGEAGSIILPKSTVEDGRYILPGLNAERGNSTDIIGHDGRVGRVMAAKAPEPNDELQYGSVSISDGDSAHSM